MLEALTTNVDKPKTKILNSHLIEKNSLTILIFVILKDNLSLLIQFLSKKTFNHSKELDKKNKLKYL